MSLSRLWLVIALGLPALVALLVPMPAVDLAYQVRAGDTILATGAIPRVDTFTFSVAGQAWTDQQWLAQVLLTAVHRLGGWELLALLRAVLIVGIVALLAAVARLRGAGLRSASILALLAFVIAAPALALRPQLLAITIYSALLVLVAGRDRHPRIFLAAPLLVALWANLHGSFVLAPLLLGYAWLDDLAARRAWRRSLAVLLVAIVATCVTPFGAGVWSYALGMGTDRLIADRVSEWQRTSPLSVTGALFYVSAAAAVLVAWRGRARLAWPDWLWLAGLTVVGMWAERGVAWWPAGTVLVVAAALGRSEEAMAIPSPTPVRIRGLNALVAASLAVAVVAALPWWRAPDPLTGREGLLSYAPTGLAAALREHVTSGSRVVVPQTWGSWFEWAVPDATYFVDSRFELFPASVWATDDALAGGGPIAADALDRWQVQAVVLPRGSPPPAGAWTTVYHDDSGSILLRVPQR